MSRPISPFCLCLTAMMALVGCKSDGDKPEAGGTKSATGFQKLGIKDTVVGKGPAAKKGDKVYVLYTGKLTNGTVFDSTSTRKNEPFAVTLGAGQVIKGWDEGLIGIKKGGKRTLEIPAAKGYGAQGGGDKIPPNSDLIFDVEALDVITQEDADTIQIRDIKSGSGPALKAGDKVTVTYRVLSVSKRVMGTNKATWTFGRGDAARGIEAGMDGMKAGGVREILLPPTMGVGPQAMKYGYNPGEPLYFEMTVVKIG